MCKKGYKQSQEHKRKIGKANSIALLGHIPNNVWKKGHIPWNKGKKCPEYSERMRGKNNPSFGKYGDTHHRWIGNTPLSRNIRNCDNYIEWRIKIFKRDNFTCQECGRTNVWINAHHIKPFIKILKDNNINTIEDALKCHELWDIINGKTLCENCHIKTFIQWNR